MKLQLLLVLCISFILSCKKSSGPDQVTAKLKSVINGDIPSSEFEYNNEGRVSRIIMHGTDSYQYGDLTYTDGRIAGITDHASIWGQPLKKSGDRVFQYDAANRLTAILDKKTQSPLLANATYHFRYEFLYKGFNKSYSTCIKYSRSETGDVPYEKYIFQYDSRGNISRQESYMMVNNEWKLNDWQEFEYEPVPNPCYQTGEMMWFENYNSRDFWVKYRVSSATSPDIINTVTRSYTLEDGKIISANVSSINRVVRYEYY